MTEQEALATLTGILRDLLMDDSIVLTMETRRDQVPNWDSMTYVSFIVAVELEFKVKFTVAEVEGFANVGAVVRRILSLVNR